MKYKVQKIEQNYNQIWHRIKANNNIVVNYNFTNSMIQGRFRAQSDVKLTWEMLKWKI